MTTSLTQPQRYTLAEFVSKTVQKDQNHGLFELESPYALEVNLNNTRVWMKSGAMVAYRGHITFTREGMLEHGIGRALKKALTGEGTTLTKGEGIGKLYLADKGKKVFILNLQDETLVVNGNDLLAFDGSGGITWDIKLMNRVGAMVAGGLTNTAVSGTGMIAITTHYDPLTLLVKPGQPVFTDPNATVAWSGNLSPDLHIDMSFKTLLGRGSGESVQLKFEGGGFVIVQPYEEVPVVYTGSN